jgi:hypothetical protein
MYDAPDPHKQADPRSQARLEGPYGIRTHAYEQTALEPPLRKLDELRAELQRTF